MPGKLITNGGLSKRKREAVAAEERAAKRKIKTKPNPSKMREGSSHNADVEVARLEAEIQQSQKHYNNIKTLLTLSEDQNQNGTNSDSAAISLCRVFSRLLSQGHLQVSRSASENEAIVTEWLRGCFSQYLKQLHARLHSRVGYKTALTLLMQLVREEVLASKASPESAWRTGVFAKTVIVLIKGTEPVHGDARLMFGEEFMNRYDDVKCNTFAVISHIFKQANDAVSAESIGNCLSILLAVDPPSDNTSAPSLFCPGKSKSALASKALAQKAWVATLSSGLDKQQRKTVLGLMTYRVVPWFSKVELLMDFLTDSFEAGGATSLLALSGLFYLMQEKNLDYPNFYAKLYSLLDNDLLHSKHRSRFFRLLDTFMSSSHLPAAMVASFIKRLSRLALYAPPAAIVAVVPWVYNMLKAHPACTFMIHREPRSDAERLQLQKQGLADPFDMEEQDPTETKALESSLWELATLQSHYHPNVASLARIISEPFNKTSYNLEDFLDHSYDSLIATELGGDLKRAPVVEYEIPKRIFTMADETGGGQLETLMTKILESTT